MQFNHIDLGVTDVVAAAAFFDFTLDHIMVNGSRAILDGATGESLVLTHQPGPLTYPKNFHIGFLVETEQAVQTKHTELDQAAIEGLSPIRRLRGSLLFYCQAPGAVLIEVAHRPNRS